MKLPDLVDESGRPLIEEGFNYAALDREIEASARADAAMIKGMTKETAADLIEIGNSLLRQSKRLKHRLFLRWILLEFGMTERAARKIMRVAARFGGQSAVSGLSANALYELAASSTPNDLREEIERRLAAGELITSSEIKHVKSLAHLRQSNLTSVPGSRSTQFAELGNHDYREILARVHAIIGHRLFGPDPWLVNRETGPALQTTLMELGLDELVPGTMGTSRHTALGRLLNAGLLAAFMGQYDPWDVPEILEENGLMEEPQVEAIHHRILKGFDPEDFLRPQVQRAYLRYVSPSMKPN